MFMRGYAAEMPTACARCCWRPAGSAPRWDRNARRSQWQKAIPEVVNVIFEQHGNPGLRYRYRKGKAVPR